MNPLGPLQLIDVAFVTTLNVKLVASQVIVPPVVVAVGTVSYTHLTLPTNREV